MGSNLSFIILHYKNYLDTISCVESIINTNMDNNSIFIVDNGSDDSSYEILKQRYEKTKNIYLISNNKNLGYARGFNEGIKYAQKLFPDNFFVLLNNDTEIISQDWNKIISYKYEEYHFHVLGPDIINLDGTHANPRKVRKYTFLSINFMILKKYLEYFFLIIGIDIIEIVNKLKKSKIIKNNDNENISNFLIDKKNVELQGSCLILSKKYIDEYKGLYDGTFLYFEESILKYIIDRDNLCSVFTPELKILHKEYGSTMHVVKTEKGRKIFSIKHGIYSRKQLRNMIVRDKLNCVLMRLRIKIKN